MYTEKQREYHRRYHAAAKPAYNALISCYPFTIDDLPDEQWRPINDYYQVSNFGRVKSFKHNKTTILKPIHVQGYLKVGLNLDGKKKQYFIHRLVAQAFIPNPDNKKEVNHRDGHPMNCCADNLEWATGSENCRHAFAMGLRVNLQGADNPDAKLTNADVVYIRENPDDLTLDQLGKQFGISPSKISKIKSGKSYKNSGGTIGKIRPRKPHLKFPKEIRDQIRAEYKAGVRGCGAHVLAKKYGCSKPTIFRIVHESSGGE